MRSELGSSTLALITAIMLFSAIITISNSALDDFVAASGLAILSLLSLVFWRRRKMANSSKGSAPWMTISLGIISGVMFISSFSY